jgi:hypothetical protein
MAPPAGWIATQLLDATSRPLDIVFDRAWDIWECWSRFRYREGRAAVMTASSRAPGGSGFL